MRGGIVDQGDDGCVKFVLDSEHVWQITRETKEAQAKTLADKLTPLFNLVTVKTREQTPYGEVVCRARNPLAYKALMSILGMPAGGCRPPLGKMTQNGIKVVLEAARKVYTGSPEILQPIEEFFDVNIGLRLENPENWEKLYYKKY